MKGWIELNVLCHTDQSIEMERLGIGNKKDFEFLPYLIQVSTIASFSVNRTNEIEKCPEKGRSFVLLSGTQYECKETTNEIIELIKKSSL